MDEWKSRYQKKRAAIVSSLKEGELTAQVWQGTRKNMMGQTETCYHIEVRQGKKLIERDSCVGLEKAKARALDMIEGNWPG